MGAGAVPPRDPLAGFEELWAAYAFKQDRKKAKDAYQKLNPDATLHSAMVAEAARWASIYDAAETEPQWRTRLHTWISEEGWLADPKLKREKDATSVTHRGRKGESKKEASKKAAKTPTAGTRKPTTANGKPKAKPPTAGRCEPTTAVSKKASPRKASGSADARATKPAFGSADHEWLRGRVRSGALNVTGIAQLFSVSEQKIQSVLDGRATFTDAKWNELKASVSPRATVSDGEKSGC